MPATLTPVVGEVLARAFAGDTAGAREAAAAALVDAAADDRAALVAATALADYVDSRFTDAVGTARRSSLLAATAGEPAQLLAATALALALSNEPRLEGISHLDAFQAALDHLGGLDSLPGQIRSLALALLVEAAFATGQMAEAGKLLALESQQIESNPVAWLAMLQPARWALFGGDLATAHALCERALNHRSDAQPTRVRALFHAFAAMIAAYQEDGAKLAREVRFVRALVDVPQGWVDSGAYLVAGYALAAAGEIQQAAELVLAGGGGPDLHLAQVVDRALGYDILVTAALEAGDLAGATAWAVRAHELHRVPAAAASVEQIDARLARASGDADQASVKTAAAAARTRAAGRVLEATATDVEYARALVAAGHIPGAVGQLNSAAHQAELVGALALRSRAARELHRLGRRVEPRRGAGAQVLTTRELEVASMAAEGFTSRTIAQALSLSERTVQGHLRRAMRALDVRSRAALPAALASLPEAKPSAVPVAVLTRRQAEVAGLVRTGLSNAEIAAALGISVKTVEKHVAMIFDRWGVSSRTAVARLAHPRPA
ncbi:MAG: hypothetical protein KIT69_14455 [Propionibacteriaceae bacterium]|nr:hypothetical protein [Propionibacteriaceae bacterium]